VSANLFSVFPTGEFIVSAFNVIKTRFFKQARSLFKHLPLWDRETKQEFFAA
jgi:hypothetical protein